MSHDESSPSSQLGRAVFWTITAGATFAVSQAIIRYSAQQLPPFEVLFLRYFFGAAFMVPWMMRGGWTFIKNAPFKKFLLRSLTILCGAMLWFYALSIMPLPEASALSFANPLFTMVLAGLILKERISGARWIAVVVGFAGVLVMMRPGAEAVSIGAIIVLGSCVFNSLSGIQNRMLAQTESTAAVVAYTALLMTPMSLVPAVFDWVWPSWEMIGWSVLLSGILTLGHLAFTYSFRLAEASAMMPYQYLRLPMVVFLAYVCFGETLDVWGWAGAAIIIGSSFHIARADKIAD